MKYRLPGCLLVLLLTCFSSTLFAQQRTVSGVVRNQETKEPLSGVTVSIKGAAAKSVTNEKGEFTLSVPSNEAVLRFSYVGFTFQELTVNDKSAFDVSLTKENRALDDVVVVGYGAKKRVNVLGSVATVNLKDVEDLPVANLSTALKNTVPGLGVSQSSGRPGSSTAINIRNATTFGGLSTEPLYVIDGITFDGTTNGASNGKTAFDNLDATQIESISFLKDASAAIYGARGAYGVVLVTTKRGRPGKPSISYSAFYGISDASQMPEMLSSYDHARLLNNKYYSRGLERYRNNQGVLASVAAFYTPEELEYLKSHNYSWVDDTWKTSHLQRHTINVSGGSDRITFFGGANYYKEDGNLGDLYASRYGLRFGSNAKITNNLTANVSVSVDNAINDRPTPKGTTITDQSDQMNGTMSALLLTPRWIPMYINDLPVYSAVPGWHPRELQKTGTYARSNSTGISLNASLEYKVPVIEGLSFRVNYGNNRRMTSGKEYYVSYPLYNFVRTGARTGAYSGYGGVNYTPQNVIITSDLTTATAPITQIRNGNSLQTNAAQSKGYQLNESVNYNRKFGRHDIGLLLLAEQSETGDELVVTSVENQVIPGKDEFWAFSQDRSVYDHRSQTQESGRASYLGRFNYAYNDKYLLEAVLRADASPNFPPNSRWGYFPSIALGWKISSEEFFINNVKFLNDLRVRANYGFTGNDNVPNYQYYERYTQTTGMLFGTVQTNGLNPNVVPNPNITWEKSRFTNIGLDGSFWNRRFNFTLEYYYKHSKDMLETSTVTVPITFGGNIASQNHGILNQWGYEAAIGYSGNISKDFTFSINTNFSATDNKVVDRYYNLQSDTAYRNPIGKRTDRGIEGYIATGIMKTQADVDAWYAKHPGWLVGSDSLRVGAFNFQDINGDGRISDADISQIIKRANSLFGLGFNLGVGYKGLKLSANISLGVGGYRLYDATARVSVTETANALSYWADSWSPENPNAKYPAAGSPNLNQASTFWVTKNTNMRVNNMQLSYQLPSGLAGKYKIPQLKFYAVGTNLWNIINPQDYKDLGNNNAVDYPILRNWTFGVNVSL